MNLPLTVTQTQLLEVLLNIAIVRPVFVWGAPGIGKSSIVEQFAASLGLPCVSFLGSQLAPEDIIGVPQIVDGKSVFCPPRCPTVSDAGGATHICGMWRVTL
jgi:MoxR-like ATPase